MSNDSVYSKFGDICGMWFFSWLSFIFTWYDTLFKSCFYSVCLVSILYCLSLWRIISQRIGVQQRAHLRNLGIVGVWLITSRWCRPPTSPRHGTLLASRQIITWRRQAHWSMSNTDRPATIRTYLTTRLADSLLLMWSSAQPRTAVQQYQ